MAVISNGDVIFEDVTVAVSGPFLQLFLSPFQKRKNKLKRVKQLWSPFSCFRPFQPSFMRFLKRRGQNSIDPVSADTDGKISLIPSQIMFSLMTEREEMEERKVF